MTTRATERRHGVVLDGPELTSATTERGKVVAADTVAASSPEDALHRWWVQHRPRGRVTVAVISEAAQVATVDVASDIPAALVRRHVESRVGSRSAGHAALAVAARLGDGEQPSTTCVAAVPVDVMEGLWRGEHAATRYTVPAMAFTIGGLHLVVAHTASELTLVSAEHRPVDSVLLAAGGIATDAEPSERSAHAERLAEEVDRAIESWRRRGHAIVGDIVHVTGSGVVGDELFGALALRGYRPCVDRITELLDVDALRTAGRVDRATMLRYALAAAVAVCDPGPLGFLARPGPRDAAHPAARIRQLLGELIGRTSVDAMRVPRPRRSVLMIAAAVTVAVLGTAFAAWTIPASIGSSAADAAVSRHQHALALEQHLAPDIDLAQHNRWLSARQVQLAGPPWATIIPAIVATVPVGVILQSLELTGDGNHIAVSVTASAVSADLVPRWLARLRAVRVTATTPSVTVDRNGDATFSTSFSVSRSFQ